MSREAPHLAQAASEVVLELKRLQREVQFRRAEALDLLGEMEALVAASTRLTDLATRWLYARELALTHRRADARTWALEMDAADREAATWLRGQMQLRGYGPTQAPPPSLH